MADLQFPNYANTLYLTSHANYFRNRAQLEQQQAQREQDAQQYIDPALQGDPTAFAKLAANNPTAGNAVALTLSRLQAQHLAKVKAANDFAMSAGMGIMNADPSQRPQLYQQVRQQAQSQGYDTSSWPQNYDEGWTRFQIGRAQSAKDYFDRQASMPQPTVPRGGASGTGMPAPSPAPQGPVSIPQASMPQAQKMTGYLTSKYGLSPVAAAGVVGGLYQESQFNPNAVGDGGTSVGLAQWHNDRAQGLTQFAQSQGRNPADPQTQLDYLMTEMRNGDFGAQRAYAMLKTARTPEEATTAMMHFFRPAGYTPANPQGGNGYAQRLQYTQSLLGGPQIEQGDTNTNTPGLPPAVSGPQVATPPGTQVAGGPAVPAAPAAPQSALPQDPNDPRAHGGVMMGIKGVPVMKDGMQLYQMPDGTLQWYKQQQNRNPTPPTGMRYKPDGSLELIPGYAQAQAQAYNAKYGGGIPAEIANLHGDDFRGTDYWNTQTGDVRNNVAGLLDGSIPVSTLSKRGMGENSINHLTALAKQIDPSWSPNEGEQGKRFAASLVGNGQNAQNVVAMNVAPRHAADLVQLTDAIKQNNPQMVQGIINGLKNQFGDTAVPNMVAARNLVAIEFLKAAVGPGSLNVPLEQDFIKSISTAGTADQVRSIVAGYVDKAMERGRVLQETAKIYNIPQSQIIHPETQKYLDFLQGKKVDGMPTPKAPEPSLWDRMFGGSSGTAAPQQGAQRLSPEDAAKLPKGTPFIGLDGIPRVRQ
jgi:hypothetical protein